MKATFRKKVFTGVGVMALAGGTLLATAGSALATVPTTISSDSGATLGGIDFFNSSGVQITSGPLTAPFAAFAVTQTAPTTAQSPQKATEFAYTPKLGQTPADWGGEQIHHVTSAYPVAAPANLAGLPSTRVVYSGASNDKTLTQYIADFPNTDTSTTDGYAGIYTIRVGDIGGDYAHAEILIDTTAGTWTQQDGTFQLDATTTTLTPTPSSPQTPGTAETLSAHVADTTTPATVPVGTVKFFDNSVQIGTTQTVDGSGNASVSWTSSVLGTHPLTAVFTPTTPGTAFFGSTGSSSFVIANLDATSTALSVTPGATTAFAPEDLKATVTDTTNNVSTPANPNGWATEDTAPTYSTAGIVFDNSVNTGVIDYLHPVANVPLAGISGLSFTVNNSGGPQAAYNMEVDTTGPGTGYTTLAWEAYNNGQPLVGDGTVHTFSNLESGNWWSSHIASGPGSQASPITLSAFDTLYPNAVIISYGAHQHNAGSVSTVNHITFQSTNTTFTSNNSAGTIPTGSVSFFDNTSTLLGTVAVNASGVAEIPAYTGFAQGAHSVTAVYTPTVGSTFAGSTSAAVPFSDTAPACPNGEAATLCVDQQTVQATVAAGTITITTPYTPTNPLNLGTLVLNSSGTLLSASAAFGNTSNPTLGGSEIFVTDARAGNPNWTATVDSGAFSSTTTTTPIDGQYAGLTGVTAQPVSGNALTASNVTVTQNPAGTTGIVPGGHQGIGGSVSGTPGSGHVFANTTAGGDGSIGFTGTFTLNAPTSTAAGLYVGTVTFTVG